MMAYSGTIFPIFMSLGYGGTIVACFYAILHKIWLKISSKIFNSVVLRYNDDTFKWVNRYIKDMGYVRESAGLVAGLK